MFRVAILSLFLAACTQTQLATFVENRDTGNADSTSSCNSATTDLRAHLEIRDPERACDPCAAGPIVPAYVLTNPCDTDITLPLGSCPLIGTWVLDQGTSQAHMSVSCGGPQHVVVGANGGTYEETAYFGELTAGTYSVIAQGGVLLPPVQFTVQ